MVLEKDVNSMFSEIIISLQNIESKLNQVLHIQHNRSFDLDSLVDLISQTDIVLSALEMESTNPEFLLDHLSL